MEMPPSEYEILLNTMNAGFASVHSRIDSFKDEFHNHRIACTQLFANINTDEAIRKGAETEKKQALTGRINWGKVKTATATACMVLLAIAAVKVIFSHVGTFGW
jgi:hypothetical protein